MEFKSKKWKEKISITTVSVVAGLFIAFGASYAATTISTNIQTDGTLSVTGTSTFTGASTFSATTTISGLVFGNGWSLASTTATTSEITVYDSGANPVLIFDET